MPVSFEDMWQRVNSSRIWDEEPVFCFTADVDWASEDALDRFFKDILPYNLKPTIFVTHRSAVVDKVFREGKIERGIHPNFLPGSSHGNDFKTIVETVLILAPEAECFRAHRGFDVTDTTHLLASYGMKYDSNVGTLMQTRVRPTLLESRLIRFPIFFEDGTHLYNELELDFKRYERHFLTPGIKVISLHPMNWAVNPPALKYMRAIKDSLSREAYNRMSSDTIETHRHRGRGIADFSHDIIKFITQFKVHSLRELYLIAISQPNLGETYETAGIG
jgi:hypothetical protein